MVVVVVVVVDVVDVVVYDIEAGGKGREGG